MQAATMHGLYNHHDHDVVSSYHHHHRHHHSDRYQHPRYRNCQRCQLLSPWLHKVVFGISGSDVENLVSRISLVNINMALCVPVGSLTLFTKQCCAVFFMATLLMASCCDARKIETKSFDRSPRNYNRVLRDVHHSSLNSTIPTPSHSTHISASIDASSSPTHSPHINQQSSSATGERDAADNSIPREQTTKSELIAVLISTLEKLNALSATDSTCLRLKQIVKKDIDSTSSSSSLPPSSLNHKMFAVYLYFEEVHTSSVNNSAPANFNMSNNTSHNNSILSPANITCASDPVIGVPRTDEQTDYQGMEEVNGTGVLADDSNSTPEADGNGVLHSGRLSRTQIVVISTCSSIIGMFFIVAAILRIRNYIKRARLEQEMAKRPKFRSCSVALRGATQSMEQLRRDSLVSKTSHQNSDTTKGSSSSQTNGSSRENSSASSPRHDPDTAPLLLLTGAAQASNPASPTELQTTLQYIDEDVDPSRKKMMSSASVTSSAVHLDANLKQCGHCHSEKILVEAINACKRGHRTEFSGSNVSMPCRQNGQAGCRSEGNVNPSFSSGSIGYILLREPDFPDCGPRKKMSYHLNPINKTQGSAEVMPRMFAQTSNTDLDHQKINLKVNHCSAKELQNNVNATKSNPECVSQKHESQSRGASDQQNDQQNLPKNYSDLDRTTAVEGHTSASSISQNNPGRVEKQIKADLSREHFSDQSLRADTGDKLYPLLDISSFGFSQPDVSLSSITNQGNDFFGQKEYHYPTHQPTGLQTYKREALIDNDKVMQIVSNNIKGEVTDLNVINPIVEASQFDHANSLSNTDSSEIQIVNKIDNMTCASVPPANQVPRNTLEDSVARHEQSVCDHSIQDVTTSKNVIETTRPNTSTTHQQIPESSTEILDQNSNMLAVQAVIAQSNRPTGEELQSSRLACEAMQSAPSANVAPGGILHLITADDTGGMLQSSTAGDAAPSGMLHSGRATDATPSGILPSNGEVASNEVLQSNTADDVSNEMMQSNIAVDIASNEILLSGTVDDVVSNKILQSSTVDDVASNEMLQSSTADDVVSNEILQSSTADDVASNEMLQSSTADDVVSNEILQSSTVDDVVSNEILQSSTADDVASNEMLQSSTEDDVECNEMLQSGTVDDAISNEMLQSSTTDDVLSNDMLQSSTVDDVASNDIVQSSTADYFVPKEMLQSITADELASSRMLQLSTADDIVPSTKLQSNTAADVAPSGVLQSCTALDVVSDEMLQSSTSNDVAPSRLLQSNTEADVASSGVLQSCATVDVVSNEIVQSSTADDVSSNEILQSGAEADVASNEILQSSTSNDVAWNEMLSSTSDDVACIEMLQSSTSDDVASNEMLQSSTSDDVACIEMLQSNAEDAVPYNEMLQSSTSDDVASNEMLQSSTTDDAVSNEMLLSSTKDYIACNEMWQSNAEDAVPYNEMLQSGTESDGACNEILQSGGEDDDLCIETLQSSEEDDVASNEMLQSHEADNVECNEMLQSDAGDAVACNEMLQSSTKRDVACNEILQSGTVDDDACNEMLQSSEEDNVASNEMLQSRAADDIASNEMLQSSGEDDVASNKMLQSSTTDDAAPSGVLQSNKPTDVTQGLPIELLTSIHTQIDEGVLQPLQEMADENVMDENVFVAENSSECEAQTAFSRSFSDSLDTFTASDSEQSSCQELQSSAELSGQFMLMSQGSQASNDSPNIDQPLIDASCRQSITCQGLETEQHQIIDDHQRNNNSLTDINNRLQINGVVSTDPHGSSVNSNDLCHQLLSLTTHNQVLNSSTY